MIQFFAFLSGIVNGVFASGAGQLLVFFLVFVLKKDAHISRSVSIAVMTIATIITLVIYNTFLKLDIMQITITFVVSLIGGIIGAIFMNKIKGKYLNLISGILVFSLSVYKLFEILFLKK